MSNEVKKENQKWEDIKEIYVSNLNTYKLITASLTDLYSKYKDLVEDNAPIKALLDGGAKTLAGQKGLLDKLATTHLEETTKEVEDAFPIKVGEEEKYFRFKTGEIDVDNDEEVEVAIKLTLSYQTVMNNIMVTFRNTVTSFLTDLEKIITELSDEELKKKYSSLIEEDMEETKELRELAVKEQ